MADRDDPMANIELGNVLRKDMVTCPNETKISGEFRVRTGYGYLDWIGLRELLVAPGRKGAKNSSLKLLVDGRFWVSDLERKEKKKVSY